MSNQSYPYTYIRKKIVPTAKATVPIQCKAVQYGLGVFSGIRGYYKNGELKFFRLQDHFKRLQESADIMAMKLNLTYPKFEGILKKLIAKNKVKSDVYVRPTLYAASTKLTPRFDNPDDDLAIYMIPLKDYFDGSKGLNTCVSSWRRVDDDVISVKAKCTGLYATSAMAKTEALRNGYDEPIFLNRNGSVCEASGANIFRIKDGQVWTPPLSANILNGITRRSIIELFVQEMGILVREENFDRSMLYNADELFFTGTAAKISWIRAVDQRKIGTGKMGKTTKKIKELFEKASHGELPNYEKWLTTL